MEKKKNSGKFFRCKKKIPGFFRHKKKFPENMSGLLGVLTPQAHWHSPGFRSGFFWKIFRVKKKVGGKFWNEKKKFKEKIRMKKNSPEMFRPQSVGLCRVLPSIGQYSS
jgi:hypothetical protein